MLALSVACVSRKPASPGGNVTRQERINSVRSKSISVTYIDASVNNGPTNCFVSCLVLQCSQWAVFQTYKVTA